MVFKKSLKYDNQIILHAYVNYIFFCESAAKRIYEFDPNIKLLLILNNPIDRAYSAFWEAKKVGVESIDSFDEAIKLDKQRLNGNYREQASLTYLSHGLYSQQIETYFKYFNQNNLKIIFLRI